MESQRGEPSFISSPKSKSLHVLKNKVLYSSSMHPIALRKLLITYGLKACLSKGLLIESPAIARHVSAVFDGPLAQASYRPELTAEGRLIWRERDVDGRVVTRHREPGATWFRQIALAVTGFLPVEWLL